MRSDKVLYTGLTSASARTSRLEEQKREKQREKTDKKIKLQPVAEVVLEELAKEKRVTVMKLLETIDVTTPDEQTKSIIVALNLYKQSISGLEMRIKNILRSTK